MSIVWHGRYMDGREHPDITLAGNCFLKPSGGWSQALSAIPVAGLIGALRASDRRIPIRRKSGGVVQEIAFSEDKRAIARYARKAEIYYEGNFSMALDDAIAKATYMSHFHDERKEYKESIMRKGIPNFTQKEMRLYFESENIAKKEAYNLYMKNTDIPDLNDNKLKFAIVDGNGPLWYCYIGNEEAPEKTWRLTKGGWVDDSEENIFFAYGFDISTVSKKDFIDAMNELFVSNWFYDFVEKKKICGKQNQ